MVRFPEAEFVSSLIFKRFLSNIWSLAPENCRESFRTDSVAARVKEKSNRTKSYFSRNCSPRAIFWQSLGIFDFFILQAPRRYLRTAALKHQLNNLHVQLQSLQNDPDPTTPVIKLQEQVNCITLHIFTFFSSQIKLNVIYTAYIG